MPTYVYRRPDGTTFEVFQKISDPALTEDPDTGAPVQRVISGGAGLQFKGDGFYLTDYARKGKDGSSESKGESSGDGDSKKAEPKKKESKPATKAASSDD
ncbi:FmdB family zinc ribbon protein [Rubrivirga marina]|uniref:Putative regulatory protein FmdB zinc ribbon domain-containing protein n=1 Tax=Rubrivirga marina TaxID=1196024 RepID=A0A271J1Z4_9BACT|nr:zinc ribbon domain-containing protein [Rubrivirga marina]PAP77473.1 hypothetical protein BSZ37_14020 [Rubrivirga marina]